MIVRGVACSTIVYYAHMPAINVYVSDELHRAVKAHDLPISEVCQAALRDAIRNRDHGLPPIMRPATLGRRQSKGTAWPIKR